MMDSTENEILLLLGITLVMGGEGEVTSTSTSESESVGCDSFLTTSGIAACWNSGWCWKGRTWKRIGCRAFHPPGWVLLSPARRCNSAACCSRWNMTASKSRSAKALLLRIRSLSGGGGVSGTLSAIAADGWDSGDPWPLCTHCL